MRFNPRNTKIATGVLSVLIAGFFLPGCSQTSAPMANQTAQAQNGNLAPQPPGAPQGGSVASQLAQPPSGLATTGQFEQPPIVDISELLSPAMQSGAGYQVGQQVATNGAMGQYTITAAAEVFKDDAGTYQIESLDLLKIRLSEIPAIVQLDNMSTTDVFAQALASSAIRPVTAAANMVIHPMDTITGLPSGIGDLFGRVSMGAKEIGSSASNSFGSGKAAGQAGNATLTALGYDQMRRKLAHKLHVDPYSSDPILAKKLNHVAWVMFSARMTVDVAMMAVPGSIIITGVEVTNDLVYQTPRADLIILVQKKLKSFGLSQEEIVVFTSNTAIPLSLQVTAVKNLETLGNIPGRRAAAVAIGNVMTEYQARFLVTSLHMLDQWSQQRSPITGIKVPGVLIARDQNGTVILPAAVDYLSWTPRIAGFATDPDLLAMQNRVLWTTGKMTPLVRQQLLTNGWKVQEGSQL
jgi:hypothetical protein